MTRAFAPVGSLDGPDYMVIDLDPDDVPFSLVVETALAVRKVLDRTGAESYCKTSGKRGLHIYVPIGRKYQHEQAKMGGELVARLVNRLLPGTTTLDRRPEKRRERIYLDTTRNSRGQAVASPYCVRPHPGATVSTPLKWSEVRMGLTLGSSRSRRCRGGLTRWAVAPAGNGPSPLAHRGVATLDDFRAHSCRYLSRRNLGLEVSWQ